MKWALVVAAICLLSTLVWILGRVNGARDEAHAEVAASKIIPASLSAFTSRPGPGQPIGAAAQFQDAVLFHGRLYLCGPAGLYGYDMGGALLETYASGRELPHGPATALTTNGTHLFIAIGPR